ncbi:syncoilin-like [Lampris incognitus]|uniref:syncoilin-like n=1 Tax=Lampris incognitus TaxID=2546036 RepID=UPI0024B5BC54|nr:syncoilin-like [Lampris incognitus]
METVDSENTRDTRYLGQSRVDEPIRLQKGCTQHTAMQVEQVDMDSLGLLFNRCIQEVSRLQVQRDELVQEFLEMQKPMLRVIEHLRGKLREVQRLLTLVQLDYIAVYEDVQRVKRKLFITARDCIQNQVMLADEKYEVAQSAVTQEELKVHINSLAQELSELQETHQNQLKILRDQANKPCRPRAMSDVSHCRRASLSLQRRLSCNMRTLESWYEPRLMALLRRRQAGEEALRKSKEQGQDLRAHIQPLKEEIQKLELQRSCLEERIALMETEREDSIAQYKETEEALEETLKELSIEFQIQSKSKGDLENLKAGFLRELDSLRGSAESSETTV